MHEHTPEDVLYVLDKMAIPRSPEIKNAEPSDIATARRARKVLLAIAGLTLAASGPMNILLMQRNAQLEEELEQTKETLNAAVIKTQAELGEERVKHDETQEELFYLRLAAEQVVMDMLQSPDRESDAMKKGTAYPFLAQMGAKGKKRDLAKSGEALHEASVLRYGGDYAAALPFIEEALKLNGGSLPANLHYADTVLEMAQRAANKANLMRLLGADYLEAQKQVRLQELDALSTGYVGIGKGIYITIDRASESKLKEYEELMTKPPKKK